jgi:hypothetical protein
VTSTPQGRDVLSRFLPQFASKLAALANSHGVILDGKV